MAEEGPLKVLIVEDDPDLASALARGLRLEGFLTVIEDREPEAARLLSDEGTHAAIVDVMLGTGSGLNLVRAARTAGNRKPILMLSALETIEDRAEGLRAGADDYVVKPFAFDELLARLRVQLARADDRGATFRLDRASRTATAGAETAALTERECALLSLFLDHEGRALTRGAIFDALWSGNRPGAENVVDVYVGYLRRKLPAERFGVEIVTIRSRGFLFRRRDP